MKVFTEIKEVDFANSEPIALVTKKVFASLLQVLNFMIVEVTPIVLKQMKYL
jgi:hypothetical protein